MPRTDNFLHSEKILLVDLMRKYVKEIEDKSATNTSSIRKTNAWEALEKDFNDQNTTTMERDLKQLKGLWKRLKDWARTQVAEWERSLRKTGGGEGEKEPEDLAFKIKDLVPRHFVEPECAFGDDAGKTKYNRSSSEASQSIIGEGTGGISVDTVQHSLTDSFYTTPPGTTPSCPTLYCSASSVSTTNPALDLSTETSTSTIATTRTWTISDVAATRSSASSPTPGTSASDVFAVPCDAPMTPSRKTHPVHRLTPRSRRIGKTVPAKKNRRTLEESVTEFARKEHELKMEVMNQQLHAAKLEVELVQLKTTLAKQKLAKYNDQHQQTYVQL